MFASLRDILDYLELFSIAFPSDQLTVLMRKLRAPDIMYELWTMEIPDPIKSVRGPNREWHDFIPNLRYHNIDPMHVRREMLHEAYFEMMHMTDPDVVVRVADDTPAPGVMMSTREYSFEYTARDDKAGMIRRKLAAYVNEMSKYKNQSVAFEVHDDGRVFGMTLRLYYTP